MKLPVLSRGGLALLLVCSLCAPGAIQAQNWTPTGPFGGLIDNFAVHPTLPGVLYAAGSGGVFRTRNAGASWQWVPGAVDLRVVAIDPTQPRTLYAAALPLPGGVFKSTDEGARWMGVSRNLPRTLHVRSLVVDPARPARIYLAASNQGVWRSGDGGVTWQPVSQGLPGGGNTDVAFLAVPRRPAGTAFAGTAVGLFRTRNAGRSWEPLRRGLPGGRVAALAVAPSDPQTLYVSIEDAGIFRSRDSGSSWVPAGDPLPSAPLFPESHSLAVHPRSPLTVYAASYGTGVFRTTDGGRRWTPTAPPPSLLIFTLAVDAGGAVYAGLQSGTEAGGVLRSAGGGAPWERRNQGIVGLQTFSVAADPADPDNLVTAVNGPGLFRSANAAMRWVPVQGNFPPGRLAGVLTAEVVAGGAGTFYFVDLSRGPQRIWKSSDAERTWTPLSGPGGRPQTVRADPLDPETLYALTLSTDVPRLYRSVDGGASWTPLPGLPDTCGFSDLEVARTSTSAPTILYIAGSANVCRSEDGGATWSSASVGLPGSGIFDLAVDPQDPRTLYAGLGGSVTAQPPGVWKSTDSGVSWRVTGLDNRDILSLGVSPEPGVLWASTFSGEVYRSTDFGETWQELSGALPLEVSGFAFGPDRVYAATRNGVWFLDETN